MTTFFTSDTHFGHAGMITNGWRPFASPQEMDDTLIRNWNTLVGARDTVWHLGDFTLSGAEAAEQYLSRLNGRIHLIWGNHDRNSVRKLTRWESSQYATEIKLDGHRLTLCHYAMRVWNQCQRGSLMLFGHSHGNLEINSQSADVGVDAWPYQPITLPDILDRLRGETPFAAGDHHSVPAPAVEKVDG
jgi:calcineurin-like phosphoesterase family protein